MTYLDGDQRIEDIAWTKLEIGRGDGDDLLENFEKHAITVYTTGLTNTLDAYEQFTLEFIPDKGAALIFQRTLPSVVDSIMDLN